MSKYTTEVRFICETLAGLSESKGNNSVNEIIKTALPKLFNFDFPIFDEKYRTVLETKIVRHYYTREIGMETVGLWKMKLETKINEIMLYYNKLYLSELYEFNPIYATDITRTHEGTRNDKANRTGEMKSNGTTDGTGSGTNNSTSYNLYSDTPQGALTGVDTETYLTDVTKIKDDGLSTTKSHNSTENKMTSDETNVLDSADKYIETVKGYQGYDPNSLLSKYRENLLNIDMMIIDELEPLFMQLW